MDSGMGYDCLFDLLYSYDFEPLHDFDNNRISDVIDLQMELARKNGYDINELSDNHSISVFEVLAVMCIEGEDSVMYDPDIEDRTYVWFWDIMHNLKLDKYTDTIFDMSDTAERHVDEIISIWMNREYNYDGSDGGAFIIRHPREDLRKVDLWMQYMWWLTENYLY